MPVTLYDRFTLETRRKGSTVQYRSRCRAQPDECHWRTVWTGNRDGVELTAQGHVNEVHPLEVEGACPKCSHAVDVHGTAGCLLCNTDNKVCSGSQAGE